MPRRRTGVRRPSDAVTFARRQMVSVVVCLVLGLVLVAAAGFKLVGGAQARAALATYGVRGATQAKAVWGALIAVELVLGDRRRRRQRARRQRRRAADGRRGHGADRRDPRRPHRRAVRVLRRQGQGRQGLGGPRRAARRRLRARPAPAAHRADHRRVAGDRPGRAHCSRSSRSPSSCSRSRARSGCCGSRSPQAGALEIAHEGPEVGARSALVAPLRARAATGSASRSSPPRAAACAGCSRPPSERFGAHPSVVLRTFDEVEHAAQWAGRRRARQPVRGRARRRRHRAGQGHVQQRRAAGVRAGHGRTPPRSGHA